MLFFFYHLIKFCSNPNFYKQHPQASNYCILFAGYRKNSKLALAFGFFFVLIHFFIGMVLGLMYKWPLVQIGIILGLCLILFIYTLAIRPFIFTMVLIFEIITQLLLIIALILLLISIRNAKSGCLECAGREGTMCFLILGLLFAYLLLLALGLGLFALMAGFLGHKYFYKKKEIPVEIENSGGQDLSHLAKIENFKNEVYNNTSTGNYVTAGTMAGTAGLLAGGHAMQQSTSKYQDKRFVHEEVKTEIKNQSIEEVKIDEFSEEDQMLSQTEEVVLVKGEDTLMEDSENEEMYFNQRNRGERTMHEFSKNIRSDMNQGYSRHMGEGGMYGNQMDNSILDRTMTMKVDTDDERIKQHKVLRALSISEINTNNMEDDVNQINQAKRAIEINKRSHMTSRNMLQDLDNDYNQMGRTGFGRETREFQLGHDYDGVSNRNVNVRGYEGGSGLGTEREFLSDTNVVKTRVHSQAVRDHLGEQGRSRFETQDKGAFDTLGRDGGNYYHKEEYEEKTYYKNN